MLRQDVVVARSDCVRRHRDVAGTIVRPALREGRVRYARRTRGITTQPTHTKNDGLDNMVFASDKIAPAREQIASERSPAGRRKRHGGSERPLDGEIGCWLTTLG